uniref:hypothetical protein n=1 Tax=Endozoicomonas sp. SESOKO1 TaxID=2828742 RepID=UPI0021486EF6
IELQIKTTLSYKSSSLSPRIHHLFMLTKHKELLWLCKRLFKDVFKTHHLSATLTPVSKTGASRESKTT